MYKNDRCFLLFEEECTMTIETWDKGTMRLIAISLIKHREASFYQFLLRMTIPGRALYSEDPFLRFPLSSSLFLLLFSLSAGMADCTPYLSQRFLGFNCASQRVPLVASTVAVEKSAGVVAGLSPISYRPACPLFHPTRLPGFVLMVYLDVSWTESTLSSVCLKREFLESVEVTKKGWILPRSVLSNQSNECSLLRN